MRSLTTGIGSRKTEFHLSYVFIWWLISADLFYFRSIRHRVIKVLTSGTHIHEDTGWKTGQPLPRQGTKPVGTMCQPIMDIPNVNT